LYLLNNLLIFKKNKKKEEAKGFRFH